MIKLLNVSILADGIQKFQSQLYVGKSTVDFIMRTDGIMRCYGNGDNGMDFYEYNEPYEIVSNISDMKFQKL